MNKKTGIIVLAVVLLAGGGVALYFALLPPIYRPPTVAVARDPLFGWKFPVASTALGQPGRNLFDFQIAFSDIRDPGGVPQGLPVRLKIPVIGVDSAIEDALITPDGRMDVPEGSVNVAWFALGPHPGQIGSAVIGGHFGIRNGIPFVFYNLDKLKIGDKIYIVDDRNDTLTFVIRDIKLFNRDSDATTVFSSNDGKAHLNVITCEGIWNRVNDTYPQRRVVFTDAITSDGTAPTPVPTTATTPAPTPIRTPVPTPTPTPPFVFTRTLSMGMQGTDVEALQNILVQKGFLIIPPGMTKGNYGALTRDAVIKYQKSVGIQSDGVFGPSTLASLNPTATVTPSPTVTVYPTLPSTALNTPYATPTPMDTTVFTDTVKSMYATPKDGFITSLLLIAIAFMANTIVKGSKRYEK